MDPTAPIPRSHYRKGGRLNKTFFCQMPGCGFFHTTYRQVDRHTLDAHCCAFCGCMFDDVTRHVNCPDRERRRITGGSVNAPFLPEQLELGNFRQLQTAHQGTLARFIHEFKRTFIYLETAIEYLYDDIYNIVSQLVRHFGAVRVMFKLVARLIEIKSQQEIEYPSNSPYMSILHENFIENSVVMAVEFILGNLNVHVERGSGFSLDGMKTFEIQLGQFKVNSGRGYIPTPPKLTKKKGFINIRTNDNSCFKKCILSHFFRHTIKHPNFPNMTYVNLGKHQKKYVDKLYRLPESYAEIERYNEMQEIINFEGYEDEVSLEEIGFFEAKNHISISVYQWKDDKIAPLRITSYEFKDHVDLLLLKLVDLPEECHLEEWGSFPPEYHWILISDLSKMVCNYSKNPVKLCRWCLKSFPKNLDNHMKTCKLLHEANIEVFPEKTRHRFWQRHMRWDPPYKIYFDLETYIRKVHDAPPPVNPKKLSYTRLESNFEVCAFGISVAGPDSSCVFDHYYAGENAMEEFFVILFQVRDMIFKKWSNTLPLLLTPEEEAEYQRAKRCLECNEFFTAKNPKVRNHSHFRVNHPVTTICNKCNLLMREKMELSVWSHNGTSFDHHFIIKSLRPELQDKVSIIAKNSEKFMGIRIDSAEGNLVFLDSCQFLTASLSTLASRLKGKGSENELKKFEPLRKSFHYHPDVEMLMQKQVFCYSYLDSEERLYETRLPSIESFYDELNQENISANDYAHAKLIWEKFDCNTMEDYLKLYLKTDVMLLHCIFEDFCSFSHKTYGLSPVYSYSLPGYAYNCAMYYTKCDFEFMSDVEMINMVRQNIRGGMTYVTKRLVEAKSERLGFKNVKDEERTEILYCDFNSLYAWALEQPLAYAGYRWLNEAQLAKFDVMNIKEEGTGYIIECDLFLPDELHSLYDGFPMCPSHQKILYDELSPYQKDLVSLYSDNLSNPIGGKRLLLDLKPKEKYAVYHKLLQFYVSQGMIITKIHRVIAFEEKPFFKDFIQLNQKLRKESTDEFSRSIFKLMSNAIYGKLLSVRPNTNVHFCHSRVDALKFLSDHQMKGVRIINEDTSLFFMEGKAMKVNKPIICAFQVLDLSKLKMFDIFYNVFRKVWGDRVRPVMSDTDSHLMEVRDINNTYIADLKSMSEHFDFSNLPVHDPLHSMENASVSGKMKIVYHNILSFVGLKSKCYSILMKCKACDGGATDNEFGLCNTCKNKPVFDIKAKGLPPKSIKKVDHDQFFNVLLNEGVTYTNVRKISSKSHNVGITHQKRVALHNLDVRRYLLENKIDSLAFGNVCLRDNSQ